MKRLLAILLCAIALAPVWARRAKSVPTPMDKAKYEFRGTWIQTSFQERYQHMTPEQCQVYLDNLIDDLASTGFNAVIFQIRPEGDAFYKSSYEPWSRFLTGTQGVAPDPEWDPMAYLIDLCHRRQMEFHAWINPYRMTASKWTKMAPGHLYEQHPEWFVRYDGKLYLNPAMPECRSYVREVVKDIVSRYDVDAIHMDDYFYPYPVGGQPFDDHAAFETYAPIMGFDVQDPSALGDFRRRCVSILIKSIHEDIRALKPWVRFGVSPFGIYRNASDAYPEGSQTSGTQCYSDLYADILLWARNGWIDYVIPQLYWEIGHPQADYTTLVRWWNSYVPQSCKLYIGQSIERSLDHPKEYKPVPDLRREHAVMDRKLAQAAEGNNIAGNCFWYAYQVAGNNFHVRDYLQDNVYVQPVLPPAYTNIDSKIPEKVQKLELEMTERGLHLSWRQSEDVTPMQKPRYYCIYKFCKGDKVSTADCSHLFARTSGTEIYDTDVTHSAKYTYVVTAVDAVGNESRAVKKSLKVKPKPDTK